MFRGQPGAPPGAPPGPLCLKCYHLLDHNRKCTNKNCPNYKIGWGSGGGSGGSGGGRSGGSGGSPGTGGSAGKLIGIIVVILAVLGFLYAVGLYSENGQEQDGQQQGSQEENQEQGGQEENQEQGGQEENQEQGGQEENGQQQSDEEQGNQEQGGEEHTESETGSQTGGTVELHPVGDLEMETNEENPCLRHLSGTLENRGNMDARNVVLEIEFLNENGGTVGRGEIPVGDIPAGERRDYEDVKNICWGAGPLGASYNVRHD